MAVYEVVLRFQDRDEVRLTDRPLEVGDTLEIQNGGWLVEGEEPHDGQAAVRFICVELRERSRELRDRSSKLIGRLEDETLPGKDKRPSKGVRNGDTRSAAP